MHPTLQRLFDFFVFGAPHDLNQCAVAFNVSHVLTQIALAGDTGVAHSELRGHNLSATLQYAQRLSFVIQEPSPRGPVYRATSKLSRVQKSPMLKLSWEARWGLSQCIGEAMPASLKEKIMLADFQDWSDSEVCLLAAHQVRIARLEGGRALIDLYAHRFATALQRRR